MLLQLNNLCLAVGRVDELYAEDYEAIFPDILNKRMKKKSNLISKKQSVAAYILLDNLLREYYGVTLDALEFEEGGKPYLAQGPFISVSHTNNYVCAGVSFSPVGVDIEQIKKYDEKIAKRCFSKSENRYIKRKNSEFRFFKLWTLKEAIIKREGTSVLQMAKVELRLFLGKPFYKNYNLHTEICENCVISACFSKKTGI